MSILGNSSTLEMPGMPPLIPSGAISVSDPYNERKRRKYDSGTDDQRNTLKGSGFNPSVSDFTGQGESANAMHTYQVCIKPYMLKTSQNEVQTNWTSEIPQGQVMFVRHIGTNTVRYRNFPYPVNALTISQLNYQLHLNMHDKMEEIVTAIEAGPGISADKSEKIHKAMLEEYYMQLEDASNWTPIGVSLTLPDYVLQPSNNRLDRVVTMQCGGVCYVDNVWEQGISPGATLWLRLAGSWNSGNDSTMYKFGSRETRIIPGTSRGYFIPRIESMTSDKGISLSEECFYYKIYEKPVNTKSLNKEPYVLEQAIIYNIGYCFAPTNTSFLGRVKHGPHLPLPIYTHQLAEYNTQVQVLLTI
jgi:hypothetical protein